MRNRIISCLLSAVIAAAVVVSGYAYSGFVSKTIFEESTAHLVEIFHQANQALYNMVSFNWSRMRMWTPFIESAASEEDITAYVETAREESSFTDFFFISRDGEYMTIEGKKGYLDLRSRLEELVVEHMPIVINSVVPDQPEIMVFAVPAAHGSFRGFEYEAIAITYNNSDFVDALKISAFGGKAGTYAVLPDGRIVVDNGGEDFGNIYNLFALLKKSDRVSAEKLDEIQRDFLEGRAGQAVFDINGASCYLIYEPANFQDWMVLGVAPTEVVNASMNKLQSSTMVVVSVIIIALAVCLLLLVIRRNRQKLRLKDNELIARDELFSTLSANVNDVFLMLDAQNFDVEYVSPNIEKLLGISKKQVYKDAHALENLIRNKENARILDILPDIRPGCQVEWDREYVHGSSGNVCWFHVFAFCSDIQGAKKYILDMSDRTEDRKINQDLENAVHAAQKASLAKTTFLNNMSHDIRTPMNAIIGFTGIALKQDTNPEVRNCLEKISTSSEHLLTLINDVLDISRIESGRIKFSPTPANITQVTDMVLSIVQGFLSNRNINFTANIGETDTPYVLADSVRIREVLVNILGNAVKFTDDGGSITFETSYRSGSEPNRIFVTYTISDTGVGMSEDFAEHIFEEFTQEENGARTQYKGTGLGMAISKRYVDLMGGTITVKSKKGEGTVFTVELPLELTDASHVATKAMPNTGADLSGVKILLAEDNDINAEIATIQLEELGINVTRAHDGDEAVKLFSEAPPGTFDLIFMDIMMPKKNGYEATTDIRTLPDRPDSRTIPIIAMTANAFVEDVQASLDAGMNGHLAKPIVMDEVIRIILMNIDK